ncbi:MAG: roadblock/LC7 domain-containing protein, partial [Verrucomicrobia bacterium]|nr:roadblock/LC7 domain-containing protein [Verrucomicrobiota bacterium]
AWVLDKGGFLLTKSGAVDRFDSTTLGALAAGAFAATQGVANLIGETDFNCVYQQGENFSMIVSNVDEQALLVVVFKARVSAGAVKYYAASTLTRIADQLRAARQRAPEEGVDLSALNLADTTPVFRKKLA